ncbi:MAG: hypothetical protein JW715_11275 [Sedimentisphaerales bacterium]|nr:hypothetical protein [Sedimentisphaerales bacterium]
MPATLAKTFFYILVGHPFSVAHYCEGRKPPPYKLESRTTRYERRVTNNVPYQGRFAQNRRFFLEIFFGRNYNDTYKE